MKSSWDNIKSHSWATRHLQDPAHNKDEEEEFIEVKHPRSKKANMSYIKERIKYSNLWSRLEVDGLKPFSKSFDSSFQHAYNIIFTFLKSHNNKKWQTLSYEDISSLHLHGYKRQYKYCPKEKK